MGGPVTGKITPELVSIAKSTGADALFVVTPGFQPESEDRSTTTSVTIRDLPGVKPTTVMHAGILMVMLDRDGKLLSSKAGSAHVGPANNLGFGSSLADLGQQGLRSQALLKLRELMSTAVQQASTSMGY